LEIGVSRSKDPKMIIIGCDFHPSFQQIAILETESGECEERKLMHTTGEAEAIP
jgi:transposase